MVQRGTLILRVFGSLLAFATAAGAQEEFRHEVSAQGTGFFTKVSLAEERGITQKATKTGGVLAGYRFHWKPWLSFEGNYGYDRNSQKFFTSSGLTAIKSNVHQVTGGFVVNVPVTLTKLKPYVLAAGGALVFDPRNEGTLVTGASRQTRGVFVYGGGADYAVSRHFSARLEYRGLVYKTPDFDIGRLDADQVTHIAQPSAGIVFRF